MSNQNDKKAKIEKRFSNPQTLASAIGSLMNVFGARASDANLAENWASIVGPEIANISSVVAVKKTRNNKFNIVLRPISPAFSLELSYKTEECIKKVNVYYGYDAVEKITIRK